MAHGHQMPSTPTLPILPQSVVYLRLLPLYSYLLTLKFYVHLKVTRSPFHLTLSSLQLMPTPAVFYFMLVYFFPHQLAREDGEALQPPRCLRVW